jgi:DNA-binding MarR family transcriptional regulator
MTILMTERTLMDSSTQAQTISDLFAAIYYRAHPRYTVTLSHAAVRALQYIAFSEAPTVGMLAEHLGCAHNTASEVIQRLSQKGLIARQRSAVDERVVCVHVTDRGRQVLGEQTGLDIHRLATHLTLLSPEERDGMVQALKRLDSCLQEGSHLARHLPERG